jgi:hypothetical protein
MAEIHSSRALGDADLLEKRDRDMVASLRNLELTVVSRDQHVHMAPSGRDEEIA